MPADRESCRRKRLPNRSETRARLVAGRIATKVATAGEETIAPKLRATNNEADTQWFKQHACMECGRVPPTTRAAKTQEQRCSSYHERRSTRSEQDRAPHRLEQGAYKVGTEKMHMIRRTVSENHALPDPVKTFVAFSKVPSSTASRSAA